MEEEIFEIKNESNLIDGIALINNVYTLINESSLAMELALLKMKKMDRNLLENRRLRSMYRMAINRIDKKSIELIDIEILIQELRSFLFKFV
jgi:hypothetical protein